MNNYVINTGFREISQEEEWSYVELARRSTGGDAYSIKIEENYSYVSCGYGGFRIFDIRNLSAPIQIAHIPQTANGYAHQFILHDNIAFIGNGYGGIWIINCANPEKPSIIAEYDHDYSWDIQLNGNLAYAGNGHIIPQASITITNISEITNPIHYSTISTDDDIVDIQRLDERLYAASSTEGLLVYDITNKTDPLYLGKYVDPMHPDIYLVSFEVVGDYAFAVYYKYGLKILNISDAINITLVTEITNKNTDYFSIHVKNEIAYISDINDGILLVNVSNIINPKEIIQYTYENCGTNDIYEKDKILFIADRNLGFLIFNTTQKIETTSTTLTTLSSSDFLSTTTTTAPLPNMWVLLLFGIYWMIIRRKLKRGCN